MMEENGILDNTEQQDCRCNENTPSVDNEAEKSEEATFEEGDEQCEEAAPEATATEASEPPVPAAAPSEDMSCSQTRHVADIAQKLDGMEAAATKTAAEMRELHKLYHTEFAGRLKKMQDELDDYHEISKGRVFDSILAEIAKLYSDNEKLTDALESKQLKYMFMDLLQMLENNGVQVQKSKIGDKRNTKYCQIIEQIATDDPELHDTVAESLNTGFYVENRTLVKERVHVNIFKGQQ